MKKPKVQQRTERRISAALRLVLVAVLLAAQLALVFLLTTVLRQRVALAYTALELLAFVCAVYIWTKPGNTSYKVGWSLPDPLSAGSRTDPLRAVERRAAVQAAGSEKAAAAL